MLQEHLHLWWLQRHPEEVWSLEQPSHSVCHWSRVTGSGDQHWPGLAIAANICELSEDSLDDTRDRVWEAMYILSCMPTHVHKHARTQECTLYVNFYHNCSLWHTSYLLRAPLWQEPPQALGVSEWGRQSPLPSGSSNCMNDSGCPSPYLRLPSGADVRSPWLSALVSAVSCLSPEGDRWLPGSLERKVGTGRRALFLKSS
jgi:hypothetical protein